MGVSVALTDTAIRRAKPRERPYKLADAGGLYLHVQPTGQRYWRLKYRHAGKEKVLALGVYPDVSLAKARAGRDDAKRLLKEGRDPVSTRKQQRRAQQVAAANTFESVAREWVDHQRARWTHDHAERVLGSLEKDVFPDIGSRPISEITARELLLTIRARVERRGATETAQRILQRCGAVFKYGIGEGKCTGNPAVGMSAQLKPHVSANRPALSEKDLPEFLRKLDAYDGRPETKIGLRLLLLTFVRPGELRGARWDEFDLGRAEWRIPAERMKMRAPHLVPLSRQALAALEALHPLTGRSPFLFPNMAKHDKPMSENWHAPGSVDTALS
jgi:integrase